jgi:DNA-binding transcriptional LysR family regulator
MKGQRYELFSMLVEAARAGLGVALVPRFFVMNELAGGELAVPCELSLQDEKGYYFVYPETKQSSTLLRVFESWLIDTAKQFHENVVHGTRMNGQAVEKLSSDGGVRASS